MTNGETPPLTLWKLTRYRLHQHRLNAAGEGKRRRRCHAGLVAPDFNTLFHAPQSAHWVNGHAIVFDRVTP